MDDNKIARYVNRNDIRLRVLSEWRVFRERYVSSPETLRVTIIILSPNYDGRKYDLP